MIFITVGTHEQGLDRLLITIDKLIEKQVINEVVFAQIGYSDYKPKYYNYKDLIEYDEMDKMIQNSNIVITHGGPGCIFQAIQHGKIPLVFPRNPKFKEHVDNHQILFTKRLEKQSKVIGIYEEKDLENIILNYDKLIKNCSIASNDNSIFVKKFEKLIIGIMN
ncbi:glycosyl transferase family 28 [Romboutsia ilealis]|uniref:Glycosyl transferase family 28 n=1 Tax=Romboutsia faecis TaxID=2764597 RepID=A0ABR7JLP0_9FIRM|nr:glycosyltransferase [Romboutsia faecis]MBC5995838.1 glycosyl transferase family 28 [Romboutsia faecis]MRN23037.1 glycosyl transferase family 28 [Romboutsia ilealis]